jgi:hypothetical protein
LAGTKRTRDEEENETPEAGPSTKRIRSNESPIDFILGKEAESSLFESGMGEDV